MFPMRDVNKLNLSHMRQQIGICFLVTIDCLFCSIFWFFKSYTCYNLHAYWAEYIATHYKLRVKKTNHNV